MLNAVCWLQGRNARSLSPLGLAFCQLNWGEGAIQQEGTNVCNLSQAPLTRSFPFLSADRGLVQSQNVQGERRTTRSSEVAT